jgi:hypothetical protein
VFHADKSEYTEERAGVPQNSAGRVIAAFALC